RAEFRYVRAAEAVADPDPVVEEQRMRLKAARAVKRAFDDAQAGRHREAAEGIRRIRVVLARFGSAESQAIVIMLEAIERDVGDPQRFRERAGHIHATSSSVGMRRSTTTSLRGYVDPRTYTTGVQGRAAQDMGAGMNPNVHVGADSEEVRPRSSSST
ncbi:MAG: hypothetical protein Q7S02_06620, partial [bacterium]|nr:hypothetical protein [bacterium]